MGAGGGHSQSYRTAFCLTMSSPTRSSAPVRTWHDRSSDPFLMASHLQDRILAAYYMAAREEAWLTRDKRAVLVVGEKSQPAIRLAVGRGTLRSVVNENLVYGGSRYFEASGFVFQS